MKTFFQTKVDVFKPLCSASYEVEEELTQLPGIHKMPKESCL